MGMVGTKGCSGGYRPGAGRRPGSTSIKKDKRAGKVKASEEPKAKLAASATFFEKWHEKMMAHAAERGQSPAACGGGSQGCQQ